MDISKKVTPLYIELKNNNSMVEIAKNIYRAVRKEVFYNLLYYPYGRYQHLKVNREAIRSQSHTYTSFYRSPGQLSALIGPVMDFITRGIAKNEDVLQINVLAGSTGAEAYTLSSILLKRFPNLKVKISCSDLHNQTIEKSQIGLYQKNEVVGIDIPQEFIDDTFDREGDNYRVKPAVKNRVEFFNANIVSDNLASMYPKGDIIFLQNVLFHLDESDAVTAIDNAISTTKARFALFLDGMPLNMKVDQTKARGLNPLTYEVRKIHEYARRHVSPDWWNYYYGSEPYLFFKRNKARRYSTIFLKEQLLN